MCNIKESDKERLFRQVKHSLGAPLRKVELTDEMICTFLEISIEHIASFLQNWLVENQWSSFIGKDVTKSDIAFALTTRTLDFQDQFTYAYSKQTGLQARGPWELKKDFIEIEDGKQVYEIPAGREVNEVLWMNPPTIDHALRAHFGGFDYGFAGGQAQVGGGFGNGINSSGGMGGYYIAPAFDVLLTQKDMDLKNRLLRSDLIYKLTAGPNGTRLLHLMSTPGSKLTFGVGGNRSNISLRGCQVWYHYYETTPENVDECRLENKDIIKIPSEVPLSRLSFSDFNEPTKVYIRRLLIAESKSALGRVRGKFSGSLNIPDSELTMDYDSLLSEGKDEKEKVFDEYTEYLTKLSSDTHLERKANEAENLNKGLGFQPMEWEAI
jgi:hypothetical protein